MTLNFIFDSVHLRFVLSSSWQQEANISLNCKAIIMAFFPPIDGTITLIDVIATVK